MSPSKGVREVMSFLIALTTYLYIISDLNKKTRLIFLAKPEAISFYTVQKQTHKYTDTGIFF